MGEKYFSRKVWIYAFHISLGSFIFGYTLGVFNVPQNNVSASLGWHSLETVFISLFSALTLVGVATGAAVTAQITRKLGRRDTFRLSLIINILGCGIYSYPNTVTFGFARFITGFSVGLLSSICPLFLAEISPK